MSETQLLFLLAAMLLGAGIFAVRGALKGGVTALSRSSKVRARLREERFRPRHPG